MSPIERRLVAFISLVMYLLANTHTNLAFAVSFQSPQSDSATNCNSAPAKVDEPRQDQAADGYSECPHCAKKARAAARSKTQTADQCRAQSKCSSEGSGDSDCPCCPKGPHGPTFPCPGGCAICSVAKTPCVANDNVLTLQANCVGNCAIEEAFLYVPPSHSGLMRPPRV